MLACEGAIGTGWGQCVGFRSAAATRVTDRDPYADMVMWPKSNLCQKLLCFRCGGDCECRCSDEQAERDMSVPILCLQHEQSADHWRTHEFAVAVVRQIAHGEGPPDAVLCGFFPREQEEVVGGSGRVVQGWGEPSRLARPLIRGWRPPAAECKSSLLLDPGAVVSAII